MSTHVRSSMFLTDQICFSYFCRRSPSDYFYQITFITYFWILTTGLRAEDLQSFCFHNKPRPLAVMFFDGSIFLAIFEEGHGPSDHFGQLILNSGHWFQRRRFLKISHRYIMEIGHVPWWPCFLTDQIQFSYFVEGHPVTNWVFLPNYFEFWSPVSSRRYSKFLLPW